MYQSWRAYCPKIYIFSAFGQFLSVKRGAGNRIDFVLSSFSFLSHPISLKNSKNVGICVTLLILLLTKLYCQTLIRKTTKLTLISWFYFHYFFGLGNFVVTIFWCKIFALSKYVWKLSIIFFSFCLVKCCSQCCATGTKVQKKS